MLFTAELTVSKLLQRSLWRFCDCWIRISSFALEPFNAPTIDVTPMAKVVVEARRLAGSLGSGSGTLGLGDLDRSSSRSSFSVGDLLASSAGLWVPCSSAFSESESPAPSCAVSGGFTERGSSSAGSAGAGAEAGAAAFAAMNCSSLLLKAWCTRWDRPGPKYSLGIICIFVIPVHIGLHANSTNQPCQEKHKLTSSHPKVRDSHLNRWFTLPTKITLLITPRCVPHILTGNVQSTKLQCLRQKQNIASLWQTANLIHIQLPMHAQPFTKLQNRSQWFLRTKPIDMSCSENENPCKTHDSWQKTTQTEFHKSKFCPVRNRPKLWNSKTSQNCYSTPISAWQLFHRSFCISPRRCRRLPSLALPPGLGPLQKPIHWEETCPLRRSCERPRQTCTTSCHSRRIPKPS